MSCSAFKEFFGKIDSDCNGFISLQAFEKHFKEAENVSGKNLTDAQVQEALKAMEKDQDGKICIREVISWMIAAGYIPESCGLGGPMILSTISGGGNDW